MRAYFLASGAEPSRLDRIADRIRALSGCGRLMTAFGLGILSAAALPPFYLVPVLLLVFPPIVWLLDGCERGRAAFAVGWWFGFGNFLAGLYWISNALLVDVAQFAWLLPFVACGLPALLAFFVGGSFAATWASRSLGPGRILVFAVAWTVAEWLRGHVFTGFPWNLVGYVWTDIPSMMQPASLVGVYGLSLLTVLLAAAPAGLARGGDRDRGGRARWLLLAGATVLLAAGWIYGLVRLPDGPAATVDDLRLRIVQANVDQRLKWRPEERAEIVRRHIAMSLKPGEAPPDAIIWPETAVPFSVTDDPDLRKALATAIPPGGGLLLTGAPRLERAGETQPEFWNSLLALDRSGELVGHFDKFHLVPFGEYVPFRSVLSRLGIEKITAGSIDFSRGPGPRTLRLPGLPPVAPLICYEVIFPGAVVDPNDRPEWILNITNDGWYGFSTGPFQHLAIARMRAVEEGLPLVRAANTGISAVVDAYGRETGRLDLQVAGTMDASLPVALPPTLYSRVGDVPLFVLVLLLAALAFLFRSRSPTLPTHKL